MTSSECSTDTAKSNNRHNSVNNKILCENPPFLKISTLCLYVVLTAQKQKGNTSALVAHLAC